VILLLGAAASIAMAFDSPDEARRLLAQPPPVADTTPSRQVRVEVFEGAGPLDLRLKGPWQVEGSDTPDRIPDGSVLHVRREGERVGISWPSGSGRFAEAAIGGGDRFCIGTKCFRGEVHVVPCGSGLAVVDHLGLEEYLLGVLPGEIGRKLDPRFFEAAKAQAVVARTYTLRSLGQYSGKAWDLRNDTRDQVYDGASGEDTLCSRAVRETSGRILVDTGGHPIDAYYHSGSGGHTACIRDVWPQKPVQPYLCGVADTAPDGRAWGGAAPTGSWTESWTVAELNQAVRRDLSEALGKTVDPGEVRSLRLEGRDSSGRAAKLVVEAKNGTFEVAGDRIRWALRRHGEGRPILRSTRFELRREDGRYVAEGTGNGHGIGLSQNGAMGRSWAGQSCAQILSAYYPGTFLRNLP
jgi:stage II sporulation protein D